MTRGLEGRCSIQLSYGRTSGPTGSPRGTGPEEARGAESGRSDLNRGPPAPKAGALTGLRYAPREQEMLTAGSMSVKRGPPGA